MDKTLLAEAHLRLGWMHVDVDLLGRHFQEQKHNREARWRNDIAIGLGDRVQKEPVTNEALVHEDVD